MSDGRIHWINTKGEELTFPVLRLTGIVGCAWLCGSFFAQVAFTWQSLAVFVVALLVLIIYLRIKP